MKNAGISDLLADGITAMKNSLAKIKHNSRRAALKMEHPWYTYVAELSKYEYKGVCGDSHRRT